jgi:hypothetical protein
MLTAVAAMLTIGITPAYAYPEETFSGYIWSGDTSGNVIWYNRSVGIGGSVSDYYETDGSTQVRFHFYYHDTFLNEQTRTATFETKPFGFVEPGPRGGITYVLWYLCAIGVEGEICYYGGRITRPSS